ncbi:MAG: DUF2791 family P-loop domain-containing protein [Planctomycetes bacterium]|nr:DUF2791 family P-loop domain-containing protein [Planctomycetota bacterium]
MARVVPGARVSHADYGRGRVMLLRAGGKAVVFFEGQKLLPRTVLVDELTLQDGAAAAGEAAAAASAASLQSAAPARRPRARAPAAPGALAVAPALAGAEGCALRQVIEALRCGVVPGERVDSYTVGRQAEVQSFAHLLDEGRGVRLIFGDYGSGKTHLLEVFEQQALRRGFMTARVTLDPDNVPPSHPKRLYRAILSELRCPGQPCRGLDPVIEALFRSSAHAQAFGSRYSRFFSPVLFARREGGTEAYATLREWIEGEEVKVGEAREALAECGWPGDPPLALPDFRTYGRVYAHLLGTLAVYGKDAGFRGLVVLLDEVERIDVMTWQQLSYANEALGYFAAGALPQDELRFDPERLFKGGHPVHQELPITFLDDQPLSVVLTFTPLEETFEVVGSLVDPRRCGLDLRSLERKDYDELAARIIELYGAAYAPFRPSSERAAVIKRHVRREITSGLDSPRHVVRDIISLLDADRVGPAVEPAA